MPPKPKRQNSNGRTRIEHSAGGVVFRRTRTGLEIGLILDSYKKWTFPKGRVERGETVAQAALRETREEMGLRNVRTILPLGTTSIWFVDRFEHVGARIHKFITYFLMETPAGAWGKPQKAGHVLGIRWVPYRQAARTLQYKNMSKIIHNAIAYLDKTRNSKSEIRNNI